MSETVCHRGVVSAVDGKHISVRIVQAAACGGCAAGRLCNAADGKERRVDVVCENAETYSAGDEVMVVGSVRNGLKAVVWAYVFPLVLLVGSVLSLQSLSVSEPLCALAGLAFTGIYYMVLFALRERFGRKFTFSIQHIKG